MKNLYINQLEKGQSLDGETFGINGIRHATDKNNRPYIDFELVDKTGVVKAKVWSDSIDMVDKASLHDGSIVEVKAKVGEYNGKIQMTVYATSKADDFELNDYLPVTTKDIDELWNILTDKVNKIETPGIKKLLDNLIAKYADDIKKAPAAKSVHHNYVGGMLEHIVEMLKISESVLELYTEADDDLVTAGIIMHDIGKLQELEINGFAIDYTEIGRLIGHISLGVEMVDELNEGFLDENLKIKLKHIILSHHSVLEFGSPVTPCTIEAMIVAKVDDLSSKARLVQKVIVNNQDSNSAFAPREFGLDGQIYLK